MRSVQQAAVLGSIAPSCIVPCLCLHRDNFARPLFFNSYHSIFVSKVRCKELTIKIPFNLHLSWPTPVQDFEMFLTSSVTKSCSTRLQVVDVHSTIYRTTLEATRTVPRMNLVLETESIQAFFNLGTNVRVLDTRLSDTQFSVPSCPFTINHSSDVTS